MEAVAQVVEESTAMVHVEPSARGVIAPTHYVPEMVLSPTAVSALMIQLDEVKRNVLRQGVDYGIIPGVDKPSLFQPGAERLLQLFGLGTRIVIGDRMSVPRVGKDGKPDGTDGWGVTVTVDAIKTINGVQVPVSTGLGYAGNDEVKWRGAPFHTLLMMARKRGLVSATRTATGASELFTQDVEDMDPSQFQSKPRASAPASVDADGFLWPFNTEDKGKPLTDVSQNSLEWFVDKYTTRDPKYAAQDEQRKALVRAELARRKGAPVVVEAEAVEVEAVEEADDATKDALKHGIQSLPAEQIKQIKNEIRARRIVWKRMSVEDAAWISERLSQVGDDDGIDF